MFPLEAIHRATTMRDAREISIGANAALTASSKTIERCDCHFHVFRANETAPSPRYKPTYHAPLNAWQTQASVQHVFRGVLVQPSFLGTDNTLMLEAISQDVHALRGVAVVAQDVTLVELHALHAAGVRGVRLNFAGHRDDLTAIRDIPCSWWSALISAHMHLELHIDIGRAAVLLPLVPSGITVVLDHFAKPEKIATNDETVTKVRNRNGSGAPTYVTLSGAYRQSAMLQARCAEMAALWRNEIGSERLLWGSDWPCTNHESAAQYPLLFQAVSAWLPAPSDVKTVLTDNPNALYWR